MVWDTDKVLSPLLRAGLASSPNGRLLISPEPRMAGLLQRGELAALNLNLQ